MKIFAYIDTIEAGLVPCIVIDSDFTHPQIPALLVKVTTTRYAYPRNSVLWWGASCIVPRDCVRKFRSSPFPKIMPHNWKALVNDPPIP